MTEPMTAEERSPYRCKVCRDAALHDVINGFADARASAPPAGVGDMVKCSRCGGSDIRMCDCSLPGLPHPNAGGFLVAPPSDPAGREEIARLRALFDAGVRQGFSASHATEWGEEGPDEKLAFEAALQRGTEGAGS